VVSPAEDMVLPRTGDAELVLGAARKAVPRTLDPHPCTVRCPRVGVSCGLYPDGRCTECGSDDRTSDPAELEKLVRERPELLVSVCEGFLLLRKALDQPGVLDAAYAALSRR
jgi:hypothetical protein